MIGGLTYYQICWFFIIYSFAGWALEVCFAAVTLGKIVNRGFLNGPVCPVYGFGMLGLLMLMNGLTSAAGSVAGDLEHFSLSLLFLICMALSTLVELFAGWLLDMLFHTRWWDYSDKPFNFHGYICLEFSIAWGIGGVLVLRVIHPVISESTSAGIPERYGWPILLVLYILYFIDLLVTVATVRGLNKELEELDRIRDTLRRPSDAMSRRLAEGAILTSQQVGKGQVQAALAKAELKDAAQETKETLLDTAQETKETLLGAAQGTKETLLGAAQGTKETLLGAAQETKESLLLRQKQLRDNILKHTHFGAGRLLKAFPDMRNSRYYRELRDLMNRMNGKGGEDD